MASQRALYWLQRKVLCKVVLYCRDDRLKNKSGYVGHGNRFLDHLHELEEDDEVLVDPQLAPALRDLVEQLFHCAGVLARVHRSLRWARQVRVGLHGNCFVGMVCTEVLVHLVNCQGRSAFRVAKQPQARSLRAQR